MVSVRTVMISSFLHIREEGRGGERRGEEGRRGEKREKREGKRREGNGIDGRDSPIWVSRATSLQHAAYV